MARKLRPLRVVAFCLIFVAAFGVASPGQEPQEVPQVGNYPKTVDPWEIIVYQYPDFVGMWVRYKMTPGMRHKLLPRMTPGMEDKVSSIQIGSNVAVVLFRGPDFSYAVDQHPVEFRGSVAKLDIDWKVASLIVYPKALAYFLGVTLWDNRALAYDGDCACFPLPESEDLLETGWGFLGKVNMDKNANSIVSHGAPFEESIQLVLYDERNWQGTSLTLPGAAGWGGRVIQLGDFDWSDRAASLRIRWTGSKLGLGPQPVRVTVDAPPYVAPVQKKVDRLLSAPVRVKVDAPPSVIDISGQWQSNIGLVYDIR